MRQGIESLQERWQAFALAHVALCARGLRDVNKARTIVNREKKDLDAR